jgi:hypothetical protein
LINFEFAFRFNRRFYRMTAFKIRQLTAHFRKETLINTHFSTPDPRHLWGENATHPRGLFLNALDGVANPRDTQGIGRDSAPCQGIQKQASRAR